MMTVLSWSLLIILLLASAILILMVLLHKGKGGGLSSMFGGGMSSVASGSTVAEKNLTRITIGVGIIWFAAIIAFGLIMRTMV
ncbi:preprotein translocase subunit SecG [Glycomyces dulcitolivorans]|jgi:preprotein translocase subunit SecG|uniref:preprotein translocase subunit SecG n=1 Tax=Glycomyces dulcitolivorans TaxID=2200759 RepID=UPI001E3DAA9E|nr:preprotein translocase subunit SecG [Glycomyces dulcitolivorans]